MRLDDEVVRGMEMGKAHKVSIAIQSCQCFNGSSTGGGC